MPLAPHVGGSFAPELTAAKLASYKTLAASAPPSVRDEMLKLVSMVETFRQTPASKNGGKPHPSGRGTIVPLEDAEIKRIWDLVPWNTEVPGEHVNECAVLAQLFDGIDPVGQKPLRDAAHHLLWHAVELALDREPLTADKL